MMERCRHCSMVFFVLLLLLPQLNSADIFQWVDQEGNKHFSDRPHHNAKVLRVHAGQSYHQVKKVYDGDTLLLDNGQKVRLLGVNTPEVEGRYKEAQAGGEEAKRWLQKVLKNKKVHIERDVEKKDKYGRVLAYVFVEGGLHINLELVKKGFASLNIYPPNLKYTDVLLKAQKQAEKKQLGIWGHKDYAVKKVAKIKKQRFRGWQRVVGKVKMIQHARKYSYLKLSGKVAIKIEKKMNKYFPDLNSYLGGQVEVRGWISKRKDTYNMVVRHPSAIVMR